VQKTIKDGVDAAKEQQDVVTAAGDALPEGSVLVLVEPAKAAPGVYAEWATIRV
jgi:hypothetical protein